MNSSFHFQSHNHSDEINTDGLRGVRASGVLVFAAAVRWCLSFLIVLFNSSRALQPPSETTCRMHLNENNRTGTRGKEGGESATVQPGSFIVLQEQEIIIIIIIKKQHNRRA